MSSPASAQFSSSSGSGSVYTGGQATSTNSTMLSQWAATPDRAERFWATGERTRRSAMEKADTIVAFDRAFTGTRS
ncbi:hypothetical protein FSOLCH5_000202 [Fusarium solani]|uniref:Uncharacterized protein n=2 Tax=Fusarium solani species complex TaxID=232080 RepID=A0A9P9H6C0_FUSSL|nr:uncharacterized protein B0J15DRAFT_496563 [Fusarium solani]XP_052918823.1 hypothetical protein NCS57_00022000 [Fusarium keratoplasticum]KAH7250627.1 hypothetical protein B0J15DRAFT_496563 [Fusarium solani]KAI8683574.1 hypothetical protein NCS57_00022000 [Fusarium keratoplasticum]KAI8687694.1 hypothetical protein NCS55_00021400 [Fusarium keratoplasticum]KAJ4203797.1 hypothetical protein NW759_015113 [Fusarium solani]